MLNVLPRCLLFYCSIIALVSCRDKPTVPIKTRTIAAVLPGSQVPLPLFLRDVYPEPGSQVAQAAYMTGPEDEEKRLFYPTSAGICVDLHLKSLLDQNDNNLTSRDYVGRSHLEVRTLGLDSTSILVRNDLLWVSEAGGTLADERGNEIGGILIVCWKAEADLAPGVYEATYEYAQTSGRVLSYTWSFEITKE